MCFIYFDIIICKFNLALDLKICWINVRHPNGSTRNWRVKMFFLTLIPKKNFFLVTNILS